MVAYTRRDDSVIIRALEAQNGGRYTQAARLFQDAGNQCRDFQDKKSLWDAAERARRIGQSD